MSLWRRLSDKIKNGSWKDIDPFMIIEGCSNHYIGSIINDSVKQDKIKKIQAYRMNICNSCALNNEGSCNSSGDIKIEHVITKQLVVGCGCGLSCSTSTPSYNCPAGKWVAVEM